MMGGSVWSKKPPCIGCEERWVDTKIGRTCHSVCAKYKEFRAECETVYGIRKRKMEVNGYEINTSVKHRRKRHLAKKRRT